MSVWSREPPRQFQNSKPGSRRYERGKKLGEGTYGRVYACCELPDKDKFFAVKIVDAKDLTAQGCPEAEIKKLRREAEILPRVDGHPNILKFEECFGEDNDWMYFVTELVLDAQTKKSVSLEGHLQQNGKGLKEEHARKIFRQVVAGVKHLHAANIIHRDLKLENVLVYGPPGNVTAKIIDFGWSNEIGPGLSLAKSLAGSEKYASPEVKDPSITSHDCTTDLWSLGILLFVMLNARFTKQTSSTGKQEDIDAEVGELKNISEDARSVLLGLLRIPPGERISLDTLLSHAWLAENPNGTEASGWLPAIGKAIGLTGSSQSSSARASAAAPAATSAPPPYTAAAADEEPNAKVRRIVDMGFERSRAACALDSCHGDVEAAVLKLADNMPQRLK